VIGYRKKVVRHNLDMAFPGLSPKERKHIEKKFYSHMCDMFLEMIKSISIKEEELKKRFVFKDLSLINEFQEKNQSFLMIMGHYASYEWLSALQFYFDVPGYGIYKRIKNKYFDKMVRDIRGRFNSKLITNKEAIFTIRKQQKDGLMTTYAFIADQSPRVSNTHHWSTFFGHQVPTFTGVERLAKSTGMPVLHVNVKKVKRGFYEASFKMLSAKPQTTPEFKITDMFMHELENQIKAAPEYYLWTHKRFKHVKNTG
tara:strand:- start:902 stop:1669 length:768 start_codon:yes stop_codon:yes gene_type:complete